MSRGVLLLAGAVLFMLFMVLMGLGGLIAFAIGGVLAAYGLWQLLVGAGQLLRRG